MTANAREETRFKHNEELTFKARNRGNRMFGMWVAEQLGLTGEAADSYAKDVVVADFESPGDEDIFDKVRADLAAKSIDVSDHLLKSTCRSSATSRCSRSRPNSRDRRTPIAAGQPDTTRRA